MFDLNLHVCKLYLLHWTCTRGSHAMLQFKAKIQKVVWNPSIKEFKQNSTNGIILFLENGIHFLHALNWILVLNHSLHFNHKLPVFSSFLFFSTFFKLFKDYYYHCCSFLVILEANPIAFCFLWIGFDF